MVQRPEAIVRKILSGSATSSSALLPTNTTIAKGSSNAKTLPFVKGVDERT